MIHSATLPSMETVLDVLKVFTLPEATVPLVLLAAVLA